MRLPRLRALDDLPAEVQTEEEGDVDICGQEVRDVEAEEHVKAVDEDEQACPECSPDSKPWLSWKEYK